MASLEVIICVLLFCLSGRLAQSTRCIRTEKYSACYESLTSVDTEKLGVETNPFYHAFLEQISLFEKQGIGAFALHSCLHSARSNLTIDLPGNGGSFSIFLIRPSTCGSTGNVLGFFYEALSYGLANGRLVGRLSGANCSTDQRTKHIDSYLPKLFIPHNLNPTFLSQRNCSSMHMWPWQDSNSYFWKYLDMLNSIHSKTMHDYAMTNLGHMAQKHSKTAAIHFRCGDNLGHSKMGVYPFHLYKSIFKDIADSSKISKVIIYTDANRHGVNGELCWNLLSELRYAITTSEGMGGVDVSMDFSHPQTTFVNLHRADVVVCSASTFCLFSSFGSKTVYLPIIIDLFRYPKVDGKETFPGRRLFRAELLRLTGVPKPNMTEFTYFVTKKEEPAKVLEIINSHRL